MMYYYQCRFEKETPDGIVITVGWVEGVHGLKVGARVTLKGEEGYWTVKSVSDIGLTYDEYKNVVSKSRTKFASLQTNVINLKR